MVKLDLFILLERTSRFSKSLLVRDKERIKQVYNS